MTLPGGFPGGVRGDGSADERWGVDAARGAAGSRSAAGARAAAGVPAVEGLPDQGSNRLNLEATRSSQRSSQARGAATSGCGDHRSIVLGNFAPTLAARACAKIMGSLLAETVRQ